MPAMNNILSKWVPVSERSRSLALVYSGMYLGSVTGLAFSPLLIHKFGWPSVFYSFGSLGAVWVTTWATKVFLSSGVALYIWNSSGNANIVLWSHCVIFEFYCTFLFKAYSSPLEDPGISAAEKKLIASQSTAGEPVKTIPWRLILSKPPVWALIVSHFCHNWGTFILLTWMPTYYNQVTPNIKFSTFRSWTFTVRALKRCFENRFWNSTSWNRALSVFFPGSRWQFLQMLVVGLQTHLSVEEYLWQLFGR